ncbi:MAG: cobyrinate a,c-diamide synthase [Nitrospinae bacterium]|nr:cobyrinate a,c-diamide synthase [Nitrospinota bacterium]
MPENKTKPKGLIIAGTHSSVGKSSITVGFMRLLMRKGYSIKPFKVGPDYIDPSHHQRACKIPSYNLDTVMCSKKYVTGLFSRIMEKNDFAIVEGVMGLHDGASPKSERGSTAEAAKLLGLPVIFVIDGQAMARSAAALVKGFQMMDPKVKFLGVIANHVQSPGHKKIIKEAIEYHTGLRLLGCLPTDKSLHIPSRHLGLRQGYELDSHIYEQWANHIENHIDLNLIKKHLKIKKPIAGITSNKITIPSPVAPKFKVAVARDEAFQFIYQDTLDLFERKGGEVTFFSPLRDKKLPDSQDLIYFPGGYPELHLKALTANKNIIIEIIKHFKSGKTIIGECGGLMYLGKTIFDEKEKSFPMVGIFNFSTTLNPKKLTLGYRNLKLDKEEQLRLTGHEFHYSSFKINKEPHVAINSSKTLSVKDGFRKRNALAFYTHIYWGSNEPWLKYILNQNIEKEG